MAMKKREPGFLGLAKQNAKRKGMVKVPRHLNIKGQKHHAIYATKDEMERLYDAGGSGDTTEYGIPSFDSDVRGTSGTDREEKNTDAQDQQSGNTSSTTFQQMDDNDNDRPDSQDIPTAPPPQKPEFSIGYNSEKSLWENIKSIDIPGWIEQEWDKLDFSGKPKGDLTDEEKMKAIEGNSDAQKQVMGSMGGPDAAAAAEVGAKEAAYEADRKEDYDKKQGRETKRQGFLDEYKGFQGETAGLGKKSQDLSEGAMTDASGKVEGQEGYDASTATRQGGFAGDVKKLGAYEDKFGTIAADAKTRGDTAQTEFGSAATTGAGKLEGIGEGYKDVTGQAGVDASKKGAAGFEAGATDVGTVKDQFGKEGFQKDVRGMSEKALSGEVGQREAGMLKGRMEEQRMASQKGSEEKLRREMAQSGASPAEIASKVAQFQRQSASQQQQAGRSEALSSQLQGQQMGQSALAQGAQLKGQEAGMAGKQAGLAVQQAALKGQGAAMEMQGAQAQDQTKLASLQGQGAMAQAGAGMRMKGVKGGAELGMAGASQQGTMLGQGIGAVQAAGGARKDQMGGLDQQGGFIDQQGNYVQAQLASTESDITQASTEEQARLTRSAQGTPDDPRYRPPAETPPAVIEGAVDENGLPTGTTIAPGPPVELDPPIEGKAEGGPVQGGKPYIVGEKGRELFTPSQSGNITPNSQMPPSPTEVKQTGDHSFTIAPAGASAPASKGGVNAAPPQLQGAPPQQGMMQQGQPDPSQGGGMADVQRQAFDRRNEELQRGTPAQPVQEGLSPLQQGGMMGAQQLGQQPQGNQQQAMAQNQAELTKQMGQAGAVRGSWKDAQAGGGAPGGGVASMMGGGGAGALYGQGQAGIAQQGGLMGQNAPMGANQQQQADEMFKKKRQATMQGFAVGGA
jgi:hypothetical protein